MFDHEVYELHLMQQVYAALFCVANKMQAFSDEKLGSISSRQQMALTAIVHLPPEDTTLKNIAAMLGTSKQNTNKLLSSLQKKGCIEKRINPRDKRSINVQLTEAGEQLLHKSAEISIYTLAEIFTELNKEHLETLWSLLKQISRFDGMPYLGFEADMTGNKALSRKEEEIMCKFREIRRIGQ